jgi:hypothetical protein
MGADTKFGRTKRVSACLRALRSADDGVAAPEMAILLLVLLMMILGICEFGRALWTMSTLQSAVEAAARCAAINAANCMPDVPTFAANHAAGLTVPSGDFQYASRQSCGVAGHNSGALVTASYSFTPMVPAIVPGLSITLTAKSCHP